MQLLFDLLPIIIFFAAYKVAGMYVATGAIIVAVAGQLGYQWLRHRQLNKLTLISGIAVAVLGGITLALKDPIFIQWKPTVVYGLLGFGFLASQIFGAKTLTERAMGHVIELEPTLWRQLNLMWVANFLILGAANLFVVYHFSEETWVDFKLFGTTALSLLTAVAQAVWISLRTQTQPEEGD